MGNIPEQEQPKTERIITLGEEFQLFDPKHIRIERWKGDELDTFKCKLLLNIEDGIQIPLEVVANDVYDLQNKGCYLLPFGPREDGYHIDNADYDIETRREKLERLDEELQKPLDLTKNQLWLFVDSHGGELNKLGLNKETLSKGKGIEYEFPAKMLDLLKRLRLTLVTPEGQYEAMPSSDYFREGCMIFYSFYPADLGPLATSGIISKKLGSNGLALAVPSDPEKLAQIRARFVLAPEELDPETASDAVKRVQDDIGNKRW